MPKDLVNLYYESVGRNSLLLLNIPPNRDGLLSDADVASIREFRRILDETFSTNLVVDKLKQTSSKLFTYSALPLNKPLEVALKIEASFDRIMLQENIAHGQQIVDGQVEYWDGKAWQLIKPFTTVGYKRLLRFPAVRASRIRLIITHAKGPVELADVGVYKASAGE